MRLLDQLARWAPPVVIAAAGWVVVERVVAVAGAGRVWLGVLPSLAYLGLVVFVATLLAALVAGHARLRGGAFRRQPRALAVLVGVLAGAAVFRLGGSLVEGAWISRQAFAPLVRFGVPLAFGGVCGLMSLRSARKGNRHRVSGLVALGVGLCVVDAIVFPGRFAGAHLLLEASSLFAFVVAAMVVASRVPVGRRRMRVTGIALSLLAVVAMLAAVTMPAGTRSSLLLHAPPAARLLRVIGGAPPGHLYAVLSRPPADEGDQTGASEFVFEKGADMDIVLITVDALRADALPPVRGESEHPAMGGDTPRIDAWLEEATVFSNAYAQASTTLISMTRLFYSIEAHEMAEQAEVSLPAAMRATGRETVAIVNDFFVDNDQPEVRVLVDEFDRVDVYRPEQHDSISDRVVAELRREADRPRFVWLHVFALHDPGYAGRVLGPADGNWPERYRDGLRWVDGELGEVFDAIEEVGSSRNTIVILSADHGEGLGDNGVERHGTSVLEEEIRVPLAIRVPNHPGGPVDTTVGTIDLLPTLQALAGQTPDPEYRGRSLVGPVLGSADLPERGYYFTNRDLSMVGWVQGRDKLVLDLAAGATLQFDLRADPHEEEDVFDPGSERSAHLLRSLARENPELFAEELDSPRLLAVLDRRLADVDPEQPPTDFGLLLELVRLGGDDTAHARAAELFERATPAQQGQIAAVLLRAGKGGWRDRVLGALEAYAGTQAQLALVTALGRHDAPRFAPERLASFAAASAVDDATGVDAWLALIRRWRGLPPDAWHPVFHDWLAGDPPPAVAREVLVVLGRVFDRHESNAPLAALVASHLGSPDPIQRSLAADALARVGRRADASTLSAVVADREEPARVRRAALRAAAGLDPGAAPELLRREALDPLLTSEALDVIGRFELEVPELLDTIASDTSRPRRIRRRAHELRSGAADR